MLPMIYTNIVTIGYQSSTVYDIPDLGGNGALAVSGVRFTVTCRYPPDLRQNGDASVTSLPGSAQQTVVYPIHVDDTIQDLHVSPGKYSLLIPFPPLTPMAAPGILRIVSGQHVASLNESPPPTLFVAASGIKLVNDAMNDTDTPVAMSFAQLNPPVTPDPGTCETAPGGCST